MDRRVTLAVCLAVLSGCGYRAGLIVRSDIKRVAVPVFANNTFYRDIEIGLTRAVVDEMLKTTPYILAETPQADAVLEGIIISYRVPVLQESVTDEPVESQIALTVEATLVEARSDRVLKTALVREAEGFSPSLGEDEVSAREVLFRRIARVVIERVFEQDW